MLFYGVAEKFFDTFASKLVNTLSKSDTHVPSQIENLWRQEVCIQTRIDQLQFKIGVEKLYHCKSVRAA